MSKRWKLIVCSLTFSLLPLTCLYAEDVRLSTYYPAPFGNYRRLSIEDVGSDANVYGSLQIIRGAAGHLGSHMAFIRDNTSRMGLGYEQSSSTFGFGPAVNATTTAFQPTLLSIDATGEVGIGTNDPQARLHAITEDAVTNTVTDVLKLDHSSTGSSVPGFGTGILFAGDSDTVDNRDMVRIRSDWYTATDANRVSSFRVETASDLTNTGGPVSLNTHMILSYAGMTINSDGGSLVVPRKSTAGDSYLPGTAVAPINVNGMIYYNSISNKFRVYENGQWMSMETAFQGTPIGVSVIQSRTGAIAITGTTTGAAVLFSAYPEAKKVLLKTKCVMRGDTGVSTVTYEFLNSLGGIVFSMTGGVCGGVSNSQSARMIVSQFVDLPSTAVSVRSQCTLNMDASAPASAINQVAEATFTFFK